jgi:hypothetical protein
MLVNGIAYTLIFANFDADNWIFDQVLSNYQICLDAHATAPLRRPLDKLPQVLPYTCPEQAGHKLMSGLAAPESAGLLPAEWFGIAQVPQSTNQAQGS